MKISIIPPVLILMFVLLNSCNTDSAERMKINKKQESFQGMVVSAHPLASEVGKYILEKGGNAVDAAISVQFALAVVYPAAGNIGGGGFMIIRNADGGSYSLDFREKAPAKAFETMYLDQNGDVIEKLSLLGHLAIGVPGTVDGMCTAHARFGTLAWEELIKPSIKLAEQGFPLTEKEASGLNKIKDDLIKVNTIRPDFLIRDSWNTNDLIYMRDLAKTLIRIRDDGRDGFYKGITADLIIQEMERGSGLITYEDLINYRSVWRSPVTGKYRNYTIISVGPPSSGGIALIQLLKMVEPFPVKNMDWNSAEFIHLVAEAEKRVFADRAEYLGDDDFVNIPDDHLLDSSYILSRMTDFNPDSVSLNIKHGPLSAKTESMETTHFSIVDRFGNAVSVTTTLNDSYGSKVLAGGCGFFLNNEMDDFSSKPGYPNLFGLTGSTANAIQPGKRMLSSMTPAIIEKDGKLFLVLGSPGGSRIITSVFQTILNVCEFNMPIEEAVSAKRFHHQWLPDTLIYEPERLQESTKTILKSMGYNIKEVVTLGSVNAILVSGNKFTGAADPRGENSASGF